MVHNRIHVLLLLSRGMKPSRGLARPTRWHHGTGLLRGVQHSHALEDVRHVASGAPQSVERRVVDLDGPMCCCRALKLA